MGDVHIMVGMKAGSLSLMSSKYGLPLLRRRIPRLVSRSIGSIVIATLILMVSVPTIGADAHEHVWTTSVIDSVGDVGRYSSLEISPNGEYHIAYLDASEGHLKYASNASGAPATATLDGSSENGYYTSIDEDVDGKIHIAYTTATGEYLYYMTDLGGTWDRAVAMADYKVLGATSISDDGRGNVYITFHSSLFDDMYYVCNAFEGWTFHDFFKNGDVGEYSSLAMDVKNRTYTSFYSVTNHELLYNFNFVTYQAEIVDSDGDVGQYTSIGLDGSADPRPFISYYDVTNGNLKLAVRDPQAGWSKYVIDSDDDVGRYSSICVEEDATVHIAYYDATDLDLKYAVWKQGVVTTTIVDHVGDVGRYASIDVDAAGRPSIAYYDDTNGDLKLATLVDAEFPEPGKYVPNPPDMMAATLESNNSVSLTWTAPSGNASQPPVTGYRLYSGSEEGAPSRDIYIGNATQYLDVGLAYGTRYHYWVKAVNAAGIGEASAIVNITTGGAPPRYVAPAPSMPQLVASDPTASTISWTAPPINESTPLITGYRIYRGTSAASMLPIAVIGNLTVFKDVQLQSGTYFYAVAALNSVGEGPASTAVLVTMNDNAPAFELSAYLVWIIIAIVALAAVLISIMRRRR